jgi:hypothetical protein
VKLYRGDNYIEVVVEVMAMITIHKVMELTADKAQICGVEP